MNKFKLAFSASLLALAGLTGSAQASYLSVYVGTQCQPMTELDAQNLTFLSDALANNSNGMAYVSCPIMRRNGTNTNGTRDAYAIVSSFSGGTVSCDFQSRTQSGLQAAFRNDKSSASARTKLNLDVNSSGSLGTYSLFCILPAGSRIHSYVVEEFETNNINQPVQQPNHPITIRATQ